MKATFDSLYTPTISKKDYDEAVSKLNSRVEEVWKYICKVGKRKISWWAFSNDVDLGRGNGSTGGQFDPTTDKEWKK